MLNKKDKRINRTRSMIQRGKLGGLRGAVNVYSDYSLTKYAVSCNLCIRVRRDDNTELDIGFVSGVRDDAAILVFAGAGGNAWICVRYSQISSALDCVISVAADQQQICNAGAIVALTAKYNCFEPWKSTLSLNDAAGLLAINGRMSNLNAASYVVFKDSRTTNLTGYSADYVFPINCNAGLMDFGWTNLTDTFWYLVGGGTSIADRPAANLGAGVSYSFGTNTVAANIVLNDNNTNIKYIGGLRDIPKLNFSLTLSGCTNMTGITAECPNISNTLDIGNPLITGDASFLPKPSTLISLWEAGVTGIYTPNANILELYLNYNSSPSDTDSTLIACANTLVGNNGILYYKNNRTAVSDAAVATLVAKGWTLTAA